MNNTYFNKDVFPQKSFEQDNVKSSIMNANYSLNVPQLDQVFFENILRFNRGKQVHIHMTFPNSNDYRDCEFSGIIEATGRDFIILSEPSTGKWYFLLLMYINFITFDESINYGYDFNWFLVYSLL